MTDSVRTTERPSRRNLIALANTESNGQYPRYCKELGIKAHPARYPAGLPEYFIRMLTDPGDLVVDPFGGSCITGEVCERLGRQWVCIDLVEEYLQGAVGRFKKAPRDPKRVEEAQGDDAESAYYKIYRPGLTWNGIREAPLAVDGGKKRPPPKAVPAKTQPAKTSRPRAAQMDLWGRPSRG